jgi:hypothetical protein
LIRGSPPFAGASSLFFLPEYSPDLNPIEQVFAKLKHPLRRAATRSFAAVTAAIGAILDSFSLRIAETTSLIQDINRAKIIPLNPVRQITANDPNILELGLSPRLHCVPYSGRPPFLVGVLRGGKTNARRTGGTGNLHQD